jgi:hypothetical protein
MASTPKKGSRKTEALEQQIATSEILGVIASSPTDIQPVLNVVAENAARLCDAKNSVISRLNGNVLRLIEISTEPSPCLCTRPFEMFSPLLHPPRDNAGEERGGGLTERSD